MKAPLIPKLRGQFAEFLNQNSLKHLRILSSPTCVGLRYGLLSIHQMFSCHNLLLLNKSISLIDLDHGISGLRFGGSGIFKIYLIPIGYAFRPDLRGRLTLIRFTLIRKPWAFGEYEFHVFYRVLMPASSFPFPPAALTGQPSTVNGTLSYHSQQAGNPKLRHFT